MKKNLQTILEKDIIYSQKLRTWGEQKIPHPISSILAHSGDSWYWLAFLFLVWIFTDSPWRTISAFWAGSILIQAVLVLCIKFGIKRSRPAGEWGAVYRNSDPNSFPSGHATRVVMLAALAWGMNMHLAAPLLTIWALLVSFARVILGVHYLSDIIAGWILGILLAVIMLWAQPWFYSILPWVFFR